MKIAIHRANSRGHANRGWVNSWHSFSYAEYFDPERVHFGALRILNDDTIAPGQKGFGPHDRNNMETISIVLDGELEHQDSLGNRQILHKGEIQVMSTGTGVRHSEYNKNRDKPVHFLQIWIAPNRKEQEPRYQLEDIDKILIPNILNEIVIPFPGDGQRAWIYQQAWLSLGKLDAGTRLSYTMKSSGSQGVYLFVIAGELSINDDLELFAFDGMGISEAASFPIQALTDAEVLLIEVPKLK